MKLEDAKNLFLTEDGRKVCDMYKVNRLLRIADSDTAPKYHELMQTGRDGIERPSLYLGKFRPVPVEEVNDLIWSCRHPSEVTGFEELERSAPGDYALFYCANADDAASVLRKFFTCAAYTLRLLPAATALREFQTCAQGQNSRYPYIQFRSGDPCNFLMTDLVIHAAERLGQEYAFDSAIDGKIKEFRDVVLSEMKGNVFYDGCLAGIFSAVRHFCPHDTFLHSESYKIMDHMENVLRERGRELEKALAQTEELHGSRQP